MNRLDLWKQFSKEELEELIRGLNWSHEEMTTNDDNLNRTLAKEIQKELSNWKK